MATVGLGIRAALAVQEGDALNALALADLRLARRLMPVRLRRRIITTTPAASARAFCGLCMFIGTPGMARCGPSIAVLGRVLRGCCRSGVAAARRAAVFPW